VDTGKPEIFLLRVSLQQFTNLGPGLLFSPQLPKVIYAQALLLMYVVIWLTTPIRNKIIQVSAAFASILAITHLAGVVFEAVAVLGVFAVDLLSGQVVARMDKRERNKLVTAA